MTSPCPAPLDLPALPCPVTVVGDVHLSAAHPERTARLLAFLSAEAGRGGTLVLLGDLFDWWVGRGQEREPPAAEVAAALARLCAAGTRVCFQPGNRDFALTGLPGVPLEVWPDVVRTSLGGRRALLTHGDLLVSGDAAYQRLRRVLRSGPVRFALRTLPYGALARAARLLRRRSQGALRVKDPRLLDIDYGLAARWLEAADAQVLVAGHVHTGVHHRQATPPGREVLVLKDWDVRGGVVRADDRRVWLEAAP